MYAALMTGVANYLCKHFDYTPSQVRYGGTDDFWNKFNLDAVKSPGLIYGSTQISFPKGFSAHSAYYIGGTNVSETKGIRVRPVPFEATLTLGMIADNENDHFEQIHRYVELATFNARLTYRVSIPGINVIEEWESTVGDFTELSPAPGGKESNTYDPEGRIYRLEGTFNLQSQFLFTDEKKLIRCISVGNSQLDKNNIVGGIVGFDSVGNHYPNARKNFLR